MTSCRSLIAGLLAIALTLTSNPPAAARHQDGQPAELIRAYEQSLNVFQKATFRFQVKRYDEEGKELSPGALFYEESSRVWRDRNRWKISRSTTSHRRIKGKLRTFKDSWETIYPETGELRINYDVQTGKPKGMGAILRELSKAERVQVGGDFFSPVVNGKLGHNGGFTLAEVLRQSEVRVKKTQLHEREVWLLEGTGAWGYHALWLDPSRDNLALKIVQRKQLRDQVAEGMTLADASFGDGLEQVNREVEATGFAQVNGHYVVSAFTERIDHHKGGRPIDSGKYFVTLTDINLNPDFSQDPFVPSGVIPDGFPVTVGDPPSIAYEWREGKIVKSIDQSSLARLEGNWFRAGSWLGRGLLGLTAVAAGTFAAVLWFRRRSKLA